MTSGRAPEHPFRAVVVDDEPAGRDAVRTLLESVPEVEIVAEAGNADDAVEVIRRLAPDLLFLDIQMPGGDGFSVLERLGDATPAGVVLVTAHTEYARDAFEVHALDYVVKPFGRPRFLRAVERAIHRLRAEEALGLRETLRSFMDGVRGHHERDDSPEPGRLDAGARGLPARIGVRIGTRTVLVAIDDIDWVEARGDLVRLHVGDRTHLLDSRMRDLEQALPSERFLRVHRSVIVNLARVASLRRERDGSGAVELRSGVQLRVARGRWSGLERALGLEASG